MKEASSTPTTPQQRRCMASGIETLDIETAAAFAYCSVPFLRRKAQIGDVPGASRMGRRWCFIKDDLLVWIRAGSPCKDVIKGGELCRLKSGMDAGMLISPSQEQAEYESLLGLQTPQKTEPQHKNGTTKSRQTYGDA